MPASPGKDGKRKLGLAADLPPVYAEQMAFVKCHVQLDMGYGLCYNSLITPRGYLEERSVETRNREALIADFVNRQRWAVVGASQDRSKFGNRVFRSLGQAGYRVYPVNPHVKEVEGAAAYATLADLPELPEVVNLVVPPAVTEQVVREAHDLGLTRIWMQPGAESEEAISFCETHGMQVVYDACAMVRKREWN
jgi:hypothetical protein